LRTPTLRPASGAAIQAGPRIDARTIGLDEPPRAQEEVEG
jgi:hypothetical protein